MEVSLLTKNRLGFVKGTTKKPDQDSPFLPQWERCNNMVISWLLHSVSNEIAKSIIYCEYASEIWDELEERFGQTNGAKIFQVQRDLCQISQGSLSVWAISLRSNVFGMSMRL